MNLHRLAPLSRLAERRLAKINLLVIDRCDHAVIHAMRRAEVKHRLHLIEYVNRAGICAGELHGFGDNGRQHGLDIQS